MEDNEEYEDIYEDYDVFALIKEECELDDAWLEDKERENNLK